MTSATILGCLGPRLRADERAFYADVQPWGFILFARNFETPDQARRLTDALRNAVGRDAPILIDQEGGRVQRIGPPHWRQYMPPLDQTVAAGADAARAMYLRFRLIAAELRDIGIDVNCAPMCDIAEAGTHAFLKNRCYGTDVETVTRVARAAADGLRDGGVLAVMKHMPGHGRAFVDSHLDLPVVSEQAQALQARDFAPFRALNDLPMAMTAHIVFTAFDPGNPATCSPEMIRVIRQDIGFDGLLMTDDITMQAMQGTLAQRSGAARGAGCDLVLHCNGDLAEMQEVVAAAGTLDGAGLARAGAALAARTLPRPIDIAATEAEFAALLQSRVHG
ncbi:MAG: beta-hexosaminidase [Rhodobacter sp.]|nr:beta-hexosaminidase [Rhodobacter sp.]